MLHHLSLRVKNPETAARFVALMWEGAAHAIPFAEGAWIALADDAHGTAITFNPWGSCLVPGTQAARYERVPQPFAYSAAHAAIAVSREPAEVIRAATRRGWLARIVSRGGYYDVTEIWIDNAVLVETIHPRDIAHYRGLMNARAYAAMCQSPPATKMVMPNGV